MLMGRLSHKSSRQASISINTTQEPYTSPGDYEIPRLLGNISIVDSSFKSPPGYSF